MSISSRALGGDLIWWRETGQWHTVVVVWAGSDLSLFGPNPPAEVELSCRLYDATGCLLESWSLSTQPGCPVIIDSRNHEHVAEGVLAIFPIVERGVDAQAEDFPYRRLYSMVDWISDDGQITSLHSDQSTQPEIVETHLTEIIFLEDAVSRNCLVFANGPESQMPATLELLLRNHRDEELTATLKFDLSAFALTKLYLGASIPGLSEFGEGQFVTLSGRLHCRGVFIRPYVITEGLFMSGYHGGDLYRWPSLPGFIFNALGNGEVNPMFAIHTRGDLSTTVNLLNSHGNLEEDFWVDATLYNRDGNVLATRPKWLLARRNALSRASIEALIPLGADFIGYIALTFHNDNRPKYPRRLQALLEYGNHRSTARVMAWSDVWNARLKVTALREQLAGFFPVETFYPNGILPPGVICRCHYRAWCSPQFVSSIAISNCGLLSDSTLRPATYYIRLFNAAGHSISKTETLGPHATHYVSIATCFPDAERFLAPQGIGVVSVESDSDLAVIQITRNQLTGAISAEHFMLTATYHEGVSYDFCGG